jgi:predicted secreted protein
MWYNMFDDNRRKKIVLTSHCILNQNSISDGTADLPAQFSEIVKLLEENEIGIIQLPCPELMCLGLDRQDKNGASRELLQENSRIRKLLEIKENRDKLLALVQPVIYQVKQYLEYGFDIIGIIGVNRSPSCGVETTSVDNKEEQGRGVFIEVLLEELKKEGIFLNSTGTKTGKLEESITNVKNLISGYKLNQITTN